LKGCLRQKIVGAGFVVEMKMPLGDIAKCGRGHWFFGNEIIKC
jgi:hypothetical protein